MNTEVYPFKVGTFECMVISDGTFTYTPPHFPPPANLLFSNAPKEELEHTLRQNNIDPENWMEWKSPYICLLIKTGDQRVLVDTGADGLDPNTGRLMQNLQSEGTAPEDIDLVILTHCHPDHIGGNTLDQGKLAFPNARFAIWKDEWDFWMSEQAEKKLDEHVREILLGYARRNLPPIQDKLDLIEKEKEILPGIRAVSTPGHTPGHMSLEISSKGEKLLCISDVVLHPIHLEHPEWCAAVDFDPDQVVTSRRQILNLVSQEKTLVIAFHFPFPGLGYVIQKEETWQWKPIEMTV